MTDLNNNPIYNHIIKDSKGPSEWVCLMIGAMVALVAIMPSALHTILRLGPSRDTAPLGLLVGLTGLTGLLAIIAPLVPVVATVLTANRITRLVGQEDFALVPISGVSAEDIVWGLIEGQRYHFRLWIAIGTGVVASQLFVPIMIFFWDYSGSSILTPANYGSLSIIGARVITLASYPFMLWTMCITAGVWAGLPDPKRRSWRVGAVAIRLLAYPVLVPISIYAGYLSLEWFNGLSSVCCAGFEIALAFGIPLATLTTLRRDCVRLIEQDSTKEVVN